MAADSKDNEKVVLFFDIDNTLYSCKAGVNELMGKYIKDYIANTLSLDDESADFLHKNYYRQFGLAIEGLVRFNHIDAMDYNRRVDDALPLDTILKPDPLLRQLLESVDRSKVKIWLFTNAYKTHGNRVVKLLGLDGIFDGLTYCDYAVRPLVCKPKTVMFKKAMEQAGVSDPSKCYYVDDSALNCDAAVKLGWEHAIHYTEGVPSNSGRSQIDSLWELPKVVPELFVKDLADAAIRAREAADAESKITDGGSNVNEKDAARNPADAQAELVTA